jgi:ribosomal protein S12
MHLTNQNEIIAYIQSEGHNLQEHFVVWLKEVELKICQV